MGRQGPRLVPFLQKSMINKKYRNLISEDESGLIFSIVLPHKTKKLDMEDELIFKDWYALNGKKYVFHSKHYTDAKQAITASLRKSDYVEKLHISHDRLTYRILNKAEIKEKKLLKKELKNLKEVEKKNCDSDDALSSIESGYGSGVDSPQNDCYQVSLNDNFSIPSGNEAGCNRGVKLPQIECVRVLQNGNILDDKETSLLINAKYVNISGKLDRFMKLEPMDTNISTENSFATSDKPISFSNTQSFVDNLKPEDYFPENTEFLTHSVDLMDCSLEAPGLYSSGFLEPIPFENDILKLDSISDEYLNSLFKDVPVHNSSPTVVCEETINNQSTEAQNESEMPSVPEDILTEKLWNELIGEIPAIDFYTSVDFEGKGQEQISSPPDAALSDYKTEAAEKNLYLCKKCVHLGKIPILFCEPQFNKSSADTSGKNSSTETPGELKIAFDEAVLEEINGFKFVREYKFINEHLMVFLEPNDDQ